MGPAARPVYRPLPAQFPHPRRLLRRAATDESLPPECLRFSTETKSGLVYWAVNNNVENRGELYFGEVVPSLMREIVGGQEFEPRFDALVVDEAQDHNK